MSNHTAEEDTTLPYANARVGTAGREQLREVKLLVVGESGAGKTTLTRLLNGGTPNPQEPKTQGIARTSLEIACKEKGRVKFNIWDFGGAETFHAAHQFFFTARSVYLLVLDSRRDVRDSRLDYWLQIIRAHGGDSPIVLACCQCDEQAMKLEWERLRERHPQIKACVSEVSCTGGGRNGIAPGHGVEAVRAALAGVVDRYVDTDRAFRREWIALKESLEKDARAFLTFDQYDSVCAERGVELHDREPLLGSLHELGTMIHFGTHPVARDKHVLQPDWLIAAVYGLLTDETLRQNHGVLPRTELQRILFGVRNHEYTPKHEDFILELMRKCELCFPAQEGGAVVMADLLQKTPPPLELPPEALTFRYRYVALTRGLMGRFIAKMHSRLLPNGYWLTGAVLQHGKNRAKVTADPATNQIDICVDGPRAERHVVLDLIRGAFEGIHSTFSNQWKVRELVPVPGNEEELLDVASLLKAKSHGEEFYATKSSGKLPIAVILRDAVGMEETSDEPRRFGARNPIGTETMVSRGVIFPSTPRSRPTQVAEAATKAGGWRNAPLIGGVGLGLLAIAMVVLPSFWAQALLGAAATVGAVYFARNPAFPHRKLAGVVLGVLAAVNALGFALRPAMNGSAWAWNDAAAMAFTITCGLILLVLLMLDPHGGGGRQSDK